MTTGRINQVSVVRSASSFTEVKNEEEVDKR
jgi:hypothetical protein